MSHMTDMHVLMLAKTQIEKKYLPIQIQILQKNRYTERDEKSKTGS